jgi:hypothetical protein
VASQPVQTTSVAQCGTSPVWHCGPAGIVQAGQAEMAPRSGHGTGTMTDYWGEAWAWQIEEQRLPFFFRHVQVAAPLVAL